MKKLISNFVIVIVFSIVVFFGYKYLNKVIKNLFNQEAVEIYKFEKLNHLGIIMDGNRRWAKARGLPSWKGHEVGIKNAISAVEFASKAGIKYLSLYLFSIENLGRSVEEKDKLFLMMKKFLTNKDQLDKLHKENVKVCFVGDVSLFPKELVCNINKIQDETKNNKGLVLTLLFCYGGIQELLASVKKMSEKKESCIFTIESFKNNLWSKDLPDLDLVIRTGNRNRISNFLPWQISYSEIIFLEQLWPEVDINVLNESCKKMFDTSRTFGL